MKVMAAALPALRFSDRVREEAGQRRVHRATGLQAPPMGHDPYFLAQVAAQLDPDAPARPAHGWSAYRGATRRRLQPGVCADRRA